MASRIPMCSFRININKNKNKFEKKQAIPSKNARVSKKGKK